MIPKVSLAKVSGEVGEVTRIHQPGQVEGAKLFTNQELFKVQMDKLALLKFTQAQTPISISEEQNPSSEVKCTVKIVHVDTGIVARASSLYPPLLADFFGGRDPFSRMFGDPFGDNFGDPFGDNFLESAFGFGDDFDDPFSICFGDRSGNRGNRGYRIEHHQQQQTTPLRAALEAFYKAVDGMDTFL